MLLFPLDACHGDACPNEKYSYGPTTGAKRYLQAGGTGVVAPGKDEHAAAPSCCPAGGGRIAVPSVCPTISDAMGCASRGGSRTEIALAAGGTFREKVLVPASGAVFH